MLLLLPKSFSSTRLWVLFAQSRAQLEKYKIILSESRLCKKSETFSAPCQAAIQVLRNSAQPSCMPQYLRTSLEVFHIAPQSLEMYLQDFYVSLLKNLLRNYSCVFVSRFFRSTSFFLLLLRYFCKAKSSALNAELFLHFFLVFSLDFIVFYYSFILSSTLCDF